MLEQEYHKYPSLQPLMPWIDKKAPKKVSKLSISVQNGNGLTDFGKIFLTWKAPKAKNELDKATMYAVYRFAKGEKINTDDPTHLIAVVGEPRYLLEGNQTGYTFVVTALDRIHNESKPVKIKL